MKCHVKAFTLDFLIVMGKGYLTQYPHILTESDLFDFQREWILRTVWTCQVRPWSSRCCSWHVILPRHDVPWRIQIKSSLHCRTRVTIIDLLSSCSSWDREDPLGYRITTVNTQHPNSYEPFISGWLKNGQVWGRPTDLLELPDGSLLIADDLVRNKSSFKFPVSLFFLRHVGQCDLSCHVFRSGRKY